MPPKKKLENDFLSRAMSAHQSEKIDVPLMGGEDVFAKTLSASEVRGITEACRIPATSVPEKGEETEDTYDNAKLILMVVAAAIVDAKGNRLIPVGRHKEIEELPNAIKLALQAKAMSVNGMNGPEDEAEGND